MSALDRRLNAFRPDLADRRLEGRVVAARFAEGRRMRVAVPVADMLSSPAADAGLDTQLLLGAGVVVFDLAGGHAWVQAEADSYVGYVDAAALAEPAGEPSHVVAVPRTFLYSRPDMKTPRRAVLSAGSLVIATAEEETRGLRYLRVEEAGWAVARHLSPAGSAAPDFVAVAESLEHTPYLWGGASAFGIDCSGLVQLSMRMAGRQVPRDTDMQAGAIGDSVDPGPDFSALARGDLVFWKGHVAIVTGPDAVIHANGHTMSVARESLSGAIGRIGYLYGGPTGARRPRPRCPA